jgi:uncharacterized protein
METKIRRSDRAISEDEAREILAHGEYGILSTVSQDGQPYGIPVSYAYLPDGIYFHCASKGHKLDNLKSNSRVSFCVVGPTELIPEEFATRYKSAVVFGRAQEATEAEWRRGLLGLIDKYSPEYREKGEKHVEEDHGKTKVYKIVIEALTGKSRR